MPFLQFITTACWDHLDHAIPKCPQSVVSSDHIWKRRIRVKLSRDTAQHDLPCAAWTVPCIISVGFYFPRSKSSFDGSNLSSDKNDCKAENKTDSKTERKKSSSSSQVMRDGGGV